MTAIFPVVGDARRIVLSRSREMRLRDGRAIFGLLFVYSLLSFSMEGLCAIACRGGMGKSGRRKEGRRAIT
jgi:hypothetical protein